mmetsp:Transcript_101379/g.124106  ORF Transcript_101379/g.124106 Transcript_101379/m.124106 type:complete len:321 (-) Transcript_101379:127-1089(-)
MKSFYRISCRKFSSLQGVKELPLGCQGYYNRFNGRTIGITGAYGGFAREIVRQIILEGGNIVAIGRNMDKLNELKSEYGNDRVSVVGCDISNEDGQNKAVDGLIEYKADSLVNNAGAFKEQNFNECSRDCYETIMNTNLQAPLFISQGIAKYWIENSVYGNIVNISSMASLSPLLGHCLYGLSKAGMDYITKHMALELTPHNIQVNSVNATIVDSEMGTGERGYWGNEYRKKWALDRIPKGRFGQVSEIVSITTYLLSNEARFIVGQLIQVDGGLTCGASRVGAEIILPQELKAANDKIAELQAQINALQPNIDPSLKKE